jgi:1-acyl-sn-glycerol-3-phosphate acyltransferase
MGRNLRPFFAWYGAMDLAPHLWEALGLGLVTVEVEFHDVVTFARFGSRKALAQHCESLVGAALSDLNAGRRRGAARSAVP